MKEKEILDLLIREVNGAWWSEGCLFDLTTTEAKEVDDFIKEYNSDGHLVLL